MEFSCGLTREERDKRDKEEWQDFFPLFPRTILVDDSGICICAWLQTIQRKALAIYYGWEGERCVQWEYRRKPALPAPSAASGLDKSLIYRLTEDEAKTLREGGTISMPSGCRFLLPPFPSPAGPDALAEDWERLREIYDVARDEGYAAVYKQIGPAAANSPQPHLIGLAAVAKAALRSRPAQDRDAERYRWLRSEKVCTNPRYYDFWNRFLESKLVREESMDALIDAAMSQQEKRDGR